MGHVKKQLAHNRVVRWKDGLGQIRSVSLPPDQAEAIVELSTRPSLAGPTCSTTAPTAAVLAALVTARRGIADSTRRGYEQFVARRIAGTQLGDTDIRALNLTVAQRWLDEQMHAGRSPGPVIHFLRVLLAYPVEAGLMEAAPVDVRMLVHATRPSAPTQAADESEPFTLGDLGFLFDRCNAEMTAMLHLVLCGVDLNQFLCATCGEVDLAIAAAEIRLINFRVPGTREIVAHRNGIQVWKLSAAAVAALEWHRRQAQDLERWEPDAPAFPGRPASRSLDTRSFHNRLAVLRTRVVSDARDAGDESAARRFEQISIDNLRLTTAVIAHRAGASYLDIATQLHRTVPQIRTAYKLWLYPVPQHRRRAG